MVPALTYLMRVPHAIAVPSVHLLVAVPASAVVALHVLAGHTGEPMHIVPWLSLGVIAAGPLGRRLRLRVAEGWLMRALALGLLAVALRTFAGGVT